MAPSTRQVLDPGAQSRSPGLDHPLISCPVGATSSWPNWPPPARPAEPRWPGMRSPRRCTRRSTPPAGRLGELARAPRALAESEAAQRADRVLRRFVRGELLSGQARTDCDFWRRGRRQLPQVEGGDRAVVVQGRGVERAAMRWAILCDLYSAAHALWPAPSLAVAGGRWLDRRDVGARSSAGRGRAAPTPPALPGPPLHRTLREVVRSTAAAPEDWLRIPINHPRRPPAGSGS